MSSLVSLCPPLVASSAILPNLAAQLPQTKLQSLLPALLPSPAAPHLPAAFMHLPSFLTKLMLVSFLGGKFLAQNFWMSSLVSLCPPLVASSAILPNLAAQLPQTKLQSLLPALLPSPAAPHLPAAFMH